MELSQNESTKKDNDNEVQPYEIVVKDISWTIWQNSIRSVD